MSRKILKNDLEKILDISLDLSTTLNLKSLLNKILEEARKITNCDAGTLYLVEDNKLIFFVTQSEVLQKKYSKEEFKNLFIPFEMDINENSVAGYCAVMKKSLNIENVHLLPKKYPFKYNDRWDKQTGFNTVSMLVVPLVHSSIGLIGVLQLINSMDENNRIIPFSNRYEKAVNALSSYAAITIYNTKLNNQLKQSYFDTVIKLAIASEYRDKDTFDHLYRMSEYTYQIGKLLKIPDDELVELRYAAMMHDLGKIGISDNILLKPEKFNESEREIMQAHTLIGANILKGSSSKLLQKAAKIALTHHEKWDGTGYPNGLKNFEIPLEGRITAIADVFDALLSKRVYKPDFPLEKVIGIIKEERGKTFDPEITDLFLKNIQSIINSVKIEAIHDYFEKMEFIEPDELLETKEKLIHEILYQIED